MMEDQQERDHFNSIVISFQAYKDYTFKWIQKCENDWLSIPPLHQALLDSEMKLKFHTMRLAAKKNQYFIQLLLADHAEIFPSNKLDDDNEPKETEVLEDKSSAENTHSHSHSHSHSHPHPHNHSENESSEGNSNFSISNDNDSDNNSNLKFNYVNMEKVKTTLRQFARDWSEEGEMERAQSYRPILLELAERFPFDQVTGSYVNRKYIRVLCPGAGLGRLCVDICSLGFSCEGNEFSYFMLIASNFILNNRALKKKGFEIFPWVHQNINVINTADQFRVVLVPDVLPSEVIPKGVSFSMCAGEFVESYRDQVGEWDVVVTAFFVDTAKNIIEYVETISSILKKGGLWINNGPLLYHYSDSSEISIEISYEQLKKVIQSYGFKVEKENLVNCYYTSNPNSMMQVLYHCVFFVAVKVGE